MPLTILKPDDVATAGLARWGIYGLNGSGKTSFIATIPPNIPTLVASADDENVDPLLGLKHLRVTKLSRWEDMADLLDFVDTGLASGKPFFKCLVFDTWTRIQALAVNKLVGYDLIQPGQEVKYISRMPTLPKGWDAWQQAGALAGEWMRYFQRRRIHLIFLFQEQKREPKEHTMDIVEVGPALTPTALVHAKDTLKIIGRLYVAPQAGTNGEQKEGDDLNLVLTDSLSSPAALRRVDPNRQEQRMLLIGKHDLYFTKGDSRRLGYVVPEPTWGKLAVTLTPETAATTTGGA